MDNIENLKYPIGRFEYGQTYNADINKANIQIVAALPSKLFNVISSLTEDQLETPYRPDGWTIRQTVHHLADSHINAYMRFHSALTVDNPTIAGYAENLWAELPDGKVAPVDWSLQLIKNLHLRWVMLLNSLTETQLERTYYHAGYDRTFVLKEVLGLYAWHSEHHYQHIRRTCDRNGW